MQNILIFGYGIVTGMILLQTRSVFEDHRRLLIEIETLEIKIKSIKKDIEA